MVAIGGGHVNSSLAQSRLQCVKAFTTASSIHNHSPIRLSIPASSAQTISWGQQLIAPKMLDAWLHCVPYTCKSFFSVNPIERKAREIVRELMSPSTTLPFAPGFYPHESSQNRETFPALLNYRASSTPEILHYIGKDKTRAMFVRTNGIVRQQTGRWHRK